MKQKGADGDRAKSWIIQKVPFHECELVKEDHYGGREELSEGLR
jgi:hypothetical protein